MEKRKIDLILASSSPRRKELLSALGIRFEVMPSLIDEEPLDGESPSAHVCRLALEKASEISSQMPEHWVLGADTIVVINNLILGKPRDEEEARIMLARLAGQTHQVFTGYALVHHRFPEKKKVAYVVSDVLIRYMTSEEIDDYVSTGEPMDKAGAYAIQGVGSALVKKVWGSYTNVVGLPLCEVARDLKELGIFDFLKANSKP